MTPLPQPFKTAKRRVHRKRRMPTSTPAPPVGNRILSVAHGDAADRIVVSLSAPLTGYEELGDMFMVASDGIGWHVPSSVDTTDPANLVFLFADPVDDAIQWQAPAPA